MSDTAPYDTKTNAGHQLALRRLFIVFTILLVAAYLAVIAQNWREALKETSDNLAHINNMLTQGVRSTIRTHELVLLGLGNELVAQGALEHPERGRLLIERIRNIEPGIVGFGLARPDGQLILVSGISNRASLPNLAQMPESRDSFLQCIAKNRVQIGRPYFMKLLGKWVSPIRVPVHDVNGKIIAVMTAGYPLENGTGTWVNMMMPPHIESALLRKDGYLQYYNPQSQISLKETYGVPVANETVRQVNALTASSGFISMYFPRRKEHNFYVSYERLDDYGLIAGSFIPQNSVLALWLNRSITPTTLFFIYLLGSLWVYKRTAIQQENAENEVAKLTGWQQTLLDSAEYCIISTDASGIIRSFNKAATKMLGYRPDEVIGKHTPGLFHVKSELALRAAELSKELGKTVLPGFEVFVAKSRPGKADEHEWTYIRKDGSHFTVRLSVTPIHNQTGELTGFMGIAADLTESKQAQSSLRESDARYRSLFESASDSIFLMEGEHFVECNPATLRMFGCTKEQILGQPPYRFSPLFQPDGRSSKNKAQEKILDAFEGKPTTFEWQHCRYDGTSFDAEVTLNSVQINDIPHLLATVRDISERKETDARLAYMAHHDSLTGLYNRYALNQEMERALGQSATGAHHALMLIDLDRFKEINDTLGHHIGDRILQGIGSLLNNTLSHRSAFISRLGGDEFTIFLSNIEDINMLKSIAQEALHSIKQPFVIDSMKLELDASIGIALYPQDGADSHALLRTADVAMYEAKLHGRGIVFYNAATDKHSPERLAIMADLANAVREHHLRIHYQPQYDLRLQQITGFEALVRWQHPKLGLLYPDQFIPFAEVSDVIHPLTRFVLDNALKQQATWKSNGHHFSVSVNLSARSLIDDRFVELIQNLLKKHNTQPGELEIEITETALMQDPEGAAGRLERISALGVKLSIDDFGTGYSSLGYLRRLPISELKIDRLFVKDMLTSEQDANIVRSTIGLAHDLNLKVVAEGVENAEIQNLLAQMGCDLIQGYHLSRPKPWDEILQWIDTFQPTN